MLWSIVLLCPGQRRRRVFCNTALLSPAAVLWSIVLLCPFASKLRLPLRGCQANCRFELARDGSERPLLPLTFCLRLAVHTPRVCHEAQSLLTIATTRLSQRNRGRENLLAAFVDVTMGTQLRDGSIQCDNRFLIGHLARRGPPNQEPKTMKSS